MFEAEQLMQEIDNYRAELAVAKQEIERLRKFELTSPSQELLKSQVAMLREALEYYVNPSKHGGQYQYTLDALTATAETAQAHDREVAARALEEADTAQGLAGDAQRSN